jgi:hypothetical protein
MATAFAHTAPGGVALFLPDFVSETFEPGTETGGSDAAGRGLRYLEWRWAPDAGGERYITDMPCLLRDEDGAVEVVHGRHVMGLFPRESGCRSSRQPVSRRPPHHARAARSTIRAMWCSSD